MKRTIILAALVLVACYAPTDVAGYWPYTTPTPGPTPTRTPTRTPTPVPSPTPTFAPGTTEYGLQILGDGSGAEGVALDALDPEWIRARVFWSPSIQGFGWSDTVVDMAEDRGAKLILEWWYWASDTGNYADCSTVDVATHADWAGQLAARYGDRVTAWEIDNEEDMYLCGTPAAWGARYNAVRGAIRAEDADALVIPGGLSYDRYRTTDRPYGYPITYGPFRYSFADLFYDQLSETPSVLAVHHYGCTDLTRCAAWQRWWGGLAPKVANWRARTGYTGEVWVTETGEQPGKLGETWQADRVRYLMGQCAGAGVPVCIVYQAASDSFGLFDAAGNRREAADVYAELSQ